MNHFRATLTLAGPVGGADPWQADTIFGHLCWALRYAQGEAGLLRFLSAYQEAEASQREPPLLVSNGFPGELLPKPLHLEHVSLSASDDSSQAETDFARRKHLKERSLLTPQEFESARRGNFAAIGDKDPEHVIRHRVTLKNQINRLTNTTGEGGQLFGFEETFIPQVTIYCGVADGYEALARRLFESLAVSGYGKRKAVGYGAVQQVDWQPFDWFPNVPDANAAVSLSNFVPAQRDPTDGWWRTLVKYGRLGEEYAHSENPFKRPVVMLRAGSVLRHPSPRAYYGRMVRDVAPALPNVVHYGYALAVPLKVQNTT
jgi:CRISPR-associated protein Csm4